MCYLIPGFCSTPVSRSRISCSEKKNKKNKVGWFHHASDALGFFFLFDHASITVYFEDEENLFYKLQIFPLLKIIERKLMTLFKTEGKANYCNMGFRSGTDNIYQASNNDTVEIKKITKFSYFHAKIRRLW